MLKASREGAEDGGAEIRKRAGGCREGSHVRLARSLQQPDVPF